MRPVTYLYMDDSPLFADTRALLRRCGMVGLGGSCEAEALEWITRRSVDAVVQGRGCQTGALRSAAEANGIDFVAIDPPSTDSRDRGIDPRCEDVLEARLRCVVESASRRRAADHFDRLMGRSEPMLDLAEQIIRMAPSHAPILISGESGTGKGLSAAAVHDRSRYREGPFVAINCGAIPPSLVESQLFGHERGSFTGAHRRHAGCFERAENGTLFLDEIAELPLEAQVKLLRVLESNEVTRVGGERPIPLNCRVIAATNACPVEAVRAGRLRKDLFYRLSVLRLAIPPLRERREDIPELAEHFSAVLSEEEGAERRLSAGAINRLSVHAWPGNVRELRNTLHSAVILSRGPVIEERDLPLDSGGSAVREHLRIPVGIPVEEAERRLILRTLSSMGGNKSQAAGVLGISLKTLYNRLHAYGEMAPPTEVQRGLA
ncbi:MAG: sigma-54-dependent Fis family transcriptional regulator [Gemmatimonadales bacterium]|nr:MAG: sigma-54-dependent Fis family transcriptional regulator [Gemmatimonadales bacterium]